jgi:hypothetical protein
LRSAPIHFAKHEKCTDFVLLKCPVFYHFAAWFVELASRVGNVVLD